MARVAAEEHITTHIHELHVIHEGAWPAARTR